MINKLLIAAIGLGAAVAFSPLAAMAQDTTAAPAAAAAPAKAHTGSHRGHIRRKGNTAHHRARASAHHMHKMRTAPAAPADTAPKS